MTHQLRRFKRRGGRKNNACLLAGFIKSNHIIGKLFIFPAMPDILVTVLQQLAMQLFDMVFGQGNVLPGLKNQLHHRGVPNHLLFVAGVKTLDLQI